MGGGNILFLDLESSNLINNNNNNYTQQTCVEAGLVLEGIFHYLMLER